jgi:hypothetical protein
VCQLADHGVTSEALAPAATTPLVRLEDPTRQHRTIWVESLAGDFETELVKPAERGQISAGEARTSGSVKHVEVFQMGSVRTSIFGRPRPLSADRRAASPYTLNCEEPC